MSTLADSEALLRYASKSDVSASGVVKYRAFLCSRHPLEVSCDRLQLIDVEPAEIARTRGKAALVMINAVTVRAAGTQATRVDAVADPLEENPAHALIRAVVAVLPATRDEMSASEFSAWVEVCKRLASGAQGHRL